MSKVAIQGAVTGTGTFTLEAPATNTDRTLVLPDTSATLITDSAGVLNIGSGQIYKDASGNVGIGTSSPDGMLHVVGRVRTAADFVVSGAGLLRNDENSLSMEGGSGLKFRTGATLAERMRITSEGNVGIGTTTSATRLGVLSSFTNSTRVVQIASVGNTSGNQCLGIELGANTNNTSSYLLVANAAGADRLFIYGNGNVVNTNNSYGALSDVKLKENITDATPKLEKLNQVRVVNYNLIGETQKQLGVIAQELEQIFPGMIDESPDLDKKGNDLGTTTKSVKYSVFVPMLIKAIQELKAELDTVKAELAELKGAQ
jgi:hypothetical protein